MKTLLALTLLLAVSASAEASSYHCLGTDEGEVTTEPNTDITKPLKVFGHLKGAELRLYEDDGLVTLTIKKSQDDIITIVANHGALLFSERTADLNCLAQ